MMIPIWFCLLMSFITKGCSSYLNLRYRCPDRGSYTPNSAYKANLDSLLSNLYSNATQDDGFYYTTVGGRGSNDTVYGLFLCRGDVSPDVCRSCIGDARKEILELCTNGTTAIIWFDNCMLRYSESSMLGILDQSTWFTMNNKDSDTQPDAYMKLVGKMLDQIITRASSGSERKFAVLVANFSVFETVYALGQCTPDLSNFDCQICFRNAIALLPRCCNGAVGGRAVYPNCYVRYELYPFYNLSALAAPAPPPIRPPTPPTIVPNSASSKGNKGKSTARVIAASVASVTGILLLFVLCVYFLKKRREKKTLSVAETTIDMTEIPTEESIQYDFSTIEAITNCFSPDNKIGEGGYGAVYKGRLPNGQEVAVKRLSKSSTQGAAEFKNEVILVAKLLHRNLVRLLGFCLQGEEKILIYEFVPNKSLDYFLFDPEKKQQLNWSTRYKIIGGIARGLLYLHEDSLLKIIHRDLKASNVLLDEDMNSKISDFGLARIFMVDQTQENTNRIIGTYGYMAPEYVMRGLFSVKSDVFSFGVLLLEIITGMKNSSFPSSMESSGPQDLPSYAWKHWREGRPLDMVDQSLGGLYSRNEVIQCIHVGLLCVQEEVDDRPTMANVVLMLNSYSTTRRTPNPPAFFNGLSQMISAGQEADQSRSKSPPLSVNEVSTSELYPR